MYFNVLWLKHNDDLIGHNFAESAGSSLEHGRKIIQVEN
jgi:hypothetical protein